MSTNHLAELAEALFQEAGDALFLFDPDTDQLLDVNPVALRLTGFPRHELLRIPATALFHMEGKGGQQRLRRAGQQTGIFHSQEGFFLRTRQDGGWVPVNLTITRLHVKPKTLGLITARDVREQREAHAQLQKVEAELRRVLASVSDCLWSGEIDRAGQWVFRYFSPVVERITGRPPAYFLADGKRWRDAVHAEDRPRWDQAAALLRAGQATQIEYRLVWPDGSLHWVRDSVRTSPGADGRSLRLDGVLTDITERKQAEEARARTSAELAASNQQLRELAADLRGLATADRRARLELQQAHEELKRAQSQLVQAEKMSALGQMVAGVAHEINNPLAYVVNNVAVLQRDVQAVRDLLRLYKEAETASDDDRPGVLRRIHDFAERIDLAYTFDSLDGLLLRSRDGLRRIQQIVKDLRDFARLDESDLQEVDLNAGIASTLNIVRGRARKEEVQLIADLAPLPPVVCYPAKINQVILNLVANAIDACTAGGRVTVHTQPDADGVAIHVKDTGSGIDPAIRDKIFDPFFTTKPTGQGTGLGLSISYGIVQAHGGRIDVESAPGQGTCFIVRLPLKPPTG